MSNSYEQVEELLALFGPRGEIRVVSQDVV